MSLLEMKKEPTEEFRYRVAFIHKEACLGYDMDLMTANRVVHCETEEEAKKLADANTFPKKQFYWQPTIDRERKVVVTKVYTEWIDDPAPTSGASERADGEKP